MDKYTEATFEYVVIIGGLTPNKGDAVTVVPLPKPNFLLHPIEFLQWLFRNRSREGAWTVRESPHIEQQGEIRTVTIKLNKN